ncbi:uncharacterized protein BJ171DRAFT_54910 [Polychytrium aggregatum]|uniref:uncharacterized protein n=1 Tax=Polychytrium aggregatum TaxID=110093 RepID=UPI0022FDE6EA|nr:uncharacterized protein BJ171DRAFT_500067 [Polychytrium aggregatum]XP_052967981.1 uncharacterized protein BJ171DRAFT_54910 [Polychytrium aggregatum]KAI9205893.1 hypothetical protein BJ171DRAFT_500067 [Polychytrium aggregatum]KAI9205901.1 hypothetical protein BJ171DRAFT_54910 [Polychytrium aggregatum]
MTNSEESFIVSAVPASSAAKIAFRHYLEFQRNPVPGVSIHQISSRVFHVNTRLLDGPYEGICVHWELSIPNDYPYAPPMGAMTKSYRFNTTHHHHVYDGIGICADWFGNFSYMSQSAGVGCGWTPSCDFVGLMINTQVFLADPDGVVLSARDVQKLRNMDQAFECSSCPHKTAAPHPPLAVFDPEALQGRRQRELTRDEKITERARNELMCSVSKLNFVDEEEMCLGYPINLSIDRFKRPHSELYPEPVSYTAYRQALKTAQEAARVAAASWWGCGCSICSASRPKNADQDNTDSPPVTIRSSTGKTYTHWMPMYLSEDHFQKNVAVIKQTIASMAQGQQTLPARFVFRPQWIVKVIPALMNQQVVAIMKGNVHESEVAIVAYANLLRLLVRFLKEYPGLQAIINREVKDFLEVPSNRTKKACGDLGEFFIKLMLAERDGSDPRLSYSQPKMKAALEMERFARQMMWVRRENASLLDFDNSMHVRERLRRVFESTLVSNRLFVFVLEMSRLFMVPEFESGMDRNLGLPPAAILSSFQTRIKVIKSTLTNYSVLMKVIGYFDRINSDKKMLWLLKTASETSYTQGYERRPFTYRH